jgi:CheY-like chemotaxis protein
MFSTKRILLVEDDDRDAELTLAALAHYRLDSEVTVIDNGLDALDYLHYRGPFATRITANPVLILLDIKMPRVDGMEVLRQIKADPQLRIIPVVVLTSSRQEGDILRSYQYGVNAYVVKPIDFYSFTAAIRGLSVFWTLINEPPPRL